MTDTIRVLVADDHPMYLDGVAAALESVEDIHVVGRASSAGEAVALAASEQPDVAMLDLAMPGGGMTAIRGVMTASPGTRVIILSASEAAEDVLGAMRAGAAGYASKGMSAAELAAAVRSVAGGASFVAPSLAFAAISSLAQPRTNAAHSLIGTLSARERDVLRLVAEGLTNAEIGTRLGLTEKTVKHYMTGVMTKLDVTSRVEAAIWAHRVGLPELDPRGGG
jgi:DNA-binding NarL/FixJ family response regulator